MVVGRIWPNVGAASTQLTITGYKASVLVGTQVVNQTGSNQTVTFSGGFGDIDKFVITTTAGGDYWFGGEIQFSVVPAPGALALLGVAGLVGARRRRA
jgi:MYXO-CTERM domain-containing protein